MTIKFLKAWGFEMPAEQRAEIQIALDGGAEILRDSKTVMVLVCGKSLKVCAEWCLDTPGAAVKFAAALKTLRRPLRLIKQDLDTEWAYRVKVRDNFICVLCDVQGNLVKPGGNPKKQDVLTAHHWFKTKARAGMARWERACGATVHFAEHIHSLHENPCWLDLSIVFEKVMRAEFAQSGPADVILAQLHIAVNTEPTEDRVRALWYARCQPSMLAARPASMWPLVGALSTVDVEEENL